MPDLGLTDKITMANVQPGSRVLWVHFLITVAITLYTVTVLHKYNLKSMCSRLEYMRETQAQKLPVTAHTLLLTDIPGIPWNTRLDRLVRAVQGPLKSITPTRISESLEKRLAEKFWLGSGTNLVRSEAGREQLQASQAAAPGLRSQPSIREPAMDSTIYDIESVTGLQDVVSSWVSAKKMLQSGLSVEEMVKLELERVHGEDEVVCVNVMASHAVLRHLFDTYRVTKAEMRSLIERYSAAIGRREERIQLQKMMVLGPMYGSWGKETFGQKPSVVEALKFHTMRLEDLKRRVEERKLDAEVLAEPAAFVTFRTLKTTSVAASIMHHHDDSSWHFWAAPEPKDVIWDNLGKRQWERRLRNICAGVIFRRGLRLLRHPRGHGAACADFWTVRPRRLPQSLLNHDRMSANPVLSYILNMPWVHAGLVIVLPSLGLTLVLMLMPPVMAALSNWRGAISYSQIQWDTVNLYFVFKVVVIFLGSLISGIIIFSTLVNALVFRPLAIFEILGSAAPRQSFFFITFILTQGFSIRGFFNLVNPFMLVFFLWSSRQATTPEAKQRASRTLVPDYGFEVPTETLVGFQGGGMVWTTISDQVFIAITFFLIFMIGYLQLLNAPAQAALLLLVLLTVLVHWSRVSKQMSTPTKYLSVSEATTVDDGAEPLQYSNQIRDVYLPPFMRDDTEEYDALLAQSKLVQEAIGGDVHAVKQVQQSCTKLEAKARGL
eukprot:jgi/Tetstr1/465558/TSEL_010227.t1